MTDRTPCLLYDRVGAVTPMGRVSGQVIEDGSSAPVAGAFVFVVLDGEHSTPPESLPSSETDREGRYRFETLPAGRYRIAAQKEGWVPPLDPSTMQMFEVTAGQTLDGLTVWLRRGGALTGHVLGPLGQPLAEAGVAALLKRLNDKDRPMGPTLSGAPLLMPSGQSQTNHLGEFKISGLWPGEYVIMVNAQSTFVRAASSSSTMMTVTYFPGTTDISTAQAVTVQSDETVSDLTIRLFEVPALRVSGLVVDESGGPVANAMVMLMDGPRGADLLLSLTMEPRELSHSDSSGRFFFGDVPAGSYTLRADVGGVGCFGTFHDFVIDGGGTPRLIPGGPSLTPAPGTIEVTVENADVSDLKIVLLAS